MCYHNSLTKKSKELANRYKAKLQAGFEFEPIYHASAFTHPAWPVITAEQPEILQPYTWGLIPAKTTTLDTKFNIRVSTLNARSETVFETSSFKDSIRKKRCLVPSTGFYEWMDHNKKKYPHFITLMNHEVFSMAGIYEHWTDKKTGEQFRTFSILTTSANPLMKTIHNLKERMPVIIDPERETDWIKPELTDEEYQSIFLPYNQENMKAHTISKLITSRTESSNVPDVQKEFLYEELGLC